MTGAATLYVARYQLEQGGKVQRKVIQQDRVLAREAAAADRKLARRSSARGAAYELLDALHELHESIEGLQQPSFPRSSRCRLRARRAQGTKRVVLRHRPAASRLPPDTPNRETIIAAHDAALAAGQPGYIDPATGLFVLSARYLADRGYCCERGCRHCPYVTE